MLGKIVAVQRHTAKTHFAHGKGVLHGKDRFSTRQREHARQRKAKKFPKKIGPNRGSNLGPGGGKQWSLPLRWIAGCCHYLFPALFNLGAGSAHGNGKIARQRGGGRTAVFSHGNG